jgi:hypothetical protein
MPLRQNLYLSVPCDSGPPFSGNVGGRNLVVATSAGGAGDGVTTNTGMFGSAADNTTVDSSTGQPNILRAQGGTYDPTTNFKCWGWFNSTSMNRLIHQGDYDSDSSESAKLVCLCERWSCVLYMVRWRRRVDHRRQFAR